MRYSGVFGNPEIEAGALQALFVRANDVRAPLGDTSLSSGYGYNDYQSYYTRWLVIGSKVRALYTRDAGVALTIPILAGVTWSEVAGSPYDTGRKYIESQNGSWASLTASGQNSARDTTQLSLGYSFKKQYGSPYSILNTGQSGKFTPATPPLPGTSPANLNYFVFWFDTNFTNQNVPENAYIVRYVIDYLVLVSEATESDFTNRPMLDADDQLTFDQENERGNAPGFPDPTPFPPEEEEGFTG